MNKDKLKEVCAVRRNEIISIACFMAGVAVTYTIFGKKRKGAYIATDLTVGDLGKLGELLLLFFLPLAPPVLIIYDSV